MGTRLLAGNFVRRSGDSMTGNLDMAPGKTVDGRDISAMVRAKVKVGSYVSNGVDDRNINIGIDLTAKTNVHIWIAGDGAWDVAGRPELSQGDMTKLGVGAFAVNGVQALTSTGFQVGIHNSVNAAGGYTYWYVVWYEEP